MKKIAIGLLCAFSAVLVSMLGIVFGEYLKISLKPYYVTDLAISVPEVTTLSANMHQNNAYVDILPVDGKLYFFSSTVGRGHWVSAVSLIENCVQ